jgi:myo-inositol-1(or 4)-monophosphatase
VPETARLARELASAGRSGTVEDMKDLLAVAVKAGEEAALAAEAYFSSLSKLQFEVKETGKHPGADVVSQADAAVEKIIRDVVLSARPGDSVLGEEGGMLEGTGEGLTWILDPIDGTLNFSYHRGAFAVSIAACDVEGALVAVVVQVSPRRVFTAVRGEGAMLDGEPIHVTDVQKLSGALVDLGRGRSGTREHFSEVVALLDERCRDLRRSGSAALAACEVAAGELDAMYGPGLEIWDIAAGALIATEAGAVRCDIDDDVVLIAAPGISDEFHITVREALKR